MTTPRIAADAAARLAARGVAVSLPGPGMLRLDAVPCCPLAFSKPRTNLLLVEQSKRCHQFVDRDLEYRGADHALRKAFKRGPIHQEWRWIGETVRAFRAGLARALQCLSSPLPPDLAGRLIVTEGSSSAASEPAWGALLQLAGRQFSDIAPSPARLPAAWAQLVDRLAAACQARPAPAAMLLWGDARPAALRALMQATARALAPPGEVLEVSCATLAAGLATAADLDAQLVRLFAELRLLSPALVLLDRLDLLCSRSEVGLAVLADARVRGPAWLASGSVPLAAAVGADPDLRAAVLPARVSALGSGDRRAWLVAELTAAGFPASPGVLAYLLRDNADPLALGERLACLPGLRAAGRATLFPDDFPPDGAGVWPARAAEPERKKQKDEGDRHGDAETP